MTKFIIAYIALRSDVVSIYVQTSHVLWHIRPSLDKWKILRIFLYVLLAHALSLRASPAVLSLRSCIVKLDEEKSKYACLAQEIGFGSA
jgi:hypothetical protein